MYETEASTRCYTSETSRRERDETKRW